MLSAFHAAVADMQAAITDDAGELRPIDRVSFEPLAGGVRWSLWQGEALLYAVESDAADLRGFLTATKQILELRAETQRAVPDSQIPKSLTCDMSRPLKTLAPDSYAEQVGAAIRRRRIRKKLSVEAAAAAAGIAAPTWYAIEHGRSLRVEGLPAIAAVLGCKPASLLP